MSVICQTSCPGGTAAAAYFDPCAKVRKRYGYTYFGLIKCDYEFVDILDPVEWAAAVTSEDVVLSPPGILDIPLPTQNSYVYTGCGDEETGLLTYALNFLTYEMNEDLDDEEFYDAIHRYPKSYRLFWWDCYDAFRLDNNWVDPIKAGAVSPFTVAGDNPGFEFSVIQAPHLIEGEEDNRQWSMNLQVKTSYMIKSCYLPGIRAVLV